ncbi:MAG TPA: sugar phosphate isomerase/epimerase family protein [Candidatus Polarisedimenticolia bacterium]|nr:sugar phosphate isomerase/epimerase family protein [Candidatus Polarisedimenticolia bacterium]
MAVIDRRRFLTSTAALAAVAALGPRLNSATTALRKAIHITMLPEDRPFLDRFRLAVDSGFAGIEMQTVGDPGLAEQIREAAERSGLRIHSVVNSSPPRWSLSSGDQEVVRRSVAGMETSLRNAKLWGADVVLFVPAVDDQETSYRDAWNRSQKVIRDRILPLAQELKVVVAVEEVWSKFLIGPLELARYVDAFASPWVKAYVNTGKVVFYAYPQDWIRTLGRRIAKVHVKDFHLGRPGCLQVKNIGDGDIDWTEVRKALREIGYDGWVTTEIAGGDAAYLQDVAVRLDRHLA